MHDGALEEVEMPSDEWVLHGLRRVMHSEYFAVSNGTGYKRPCVGLILPLYLEGVLRKYLSG